LRVAAPWSEAGTDVSKTPRKVLGLNLTERSSGRWQGQLKITKRGPSTVRRWLCLAALRWVRHERVRSWYLRQKAQRRGQAKPVLIGVMRKLALGVYHVGGRGEPFDRQRLYRRRTADSAAPAEGLAGPGGLNNERRKRRRRPPPRLGRATFCLRLLVPVGSIQLRIEGP
jgi:hypothetical protein